MTPRTDRVVIDLVMPQPTGCAPCENAIEEIDDAAAILGHELAARGTAVQVRVTARTDRSAPGAHGVRSRLEVRVNGDAINPHGTQDCGDEGTTACDTFEWNEATYAAPPAELLTAVVHEHLDRIDRGPGVSGGSAQH
jgi:hypothetical protein